MTELRPGPDGEPLPPGESVLRLARPSKDFEATGRANPKMFELSDEDKADPIPRLSVWAERLTSRLQAASLGPGPDYTLCFRLNVDELRAVRPLPDDPAVPPMDVVWHPLTREEGGARVPITEPGAAGHAGITGLKRGGPVNQAHTKRYRFMLAEMAALVREGA